MFSGDGFHPNDSGYRHWANAFIAAIERKSDQVR